MNAQKSQAINHAKAAEAARAKKEAPAVTKEEPKKAKERPAYLLFLEKLIATGKMTQKEIAEQGWKEFPTVAKSTITTVLVDAKNQKYTRFGRVAVKDEKGILSFK